MLASPSTGRIMSRSPVELQHFPVRSGSEGGALDAAPDDRDRPQLAGVAGLRQRVPVRADRPALVADPFDLPLLIDPFPLQAGECVVCALSLGVQTPQVKPSRSPLLFIRVNSSRTVRASCLSLPT